MSEFLWPLVFPVGEFQRDFFVECILFCANISSGIPHRKCANKSHSKGRVQLSMKGQNARFLVQLSRKQFIVTFLSQLEQLLHLSNLSQRLLKLDVSASRGILFYKRCCNSKIVQVFFLTKYNFKICHNWGSRSFFWLWRYVTQL